MERPSHKEIYGKIKQATKALQNDALCTINPTVVAADALELGYEYTKVRSILLMILEEISPSHYVGGRPPQQSYEKGILGKELFAFRWVSKLFGRKVYLKFSIVDDEMYLVSLHSDHSEGGKHNGDYQKGGEALQ